MQKNRMIIFSLVAVVAVAGATVGVLLFLSGKNDSVKTTPPPISVIEETAKPPATPDTCNLVSVDIIKSALGDAVRDVKPGEKSEAKAANGNLAGNCTFTFSTETSADNQLGVSVYLYKAGDGSEGSGEPALDTSWSYASDLPYDGFFQEATNNGRHTFTARVVNGASIYLFSISQPEATTTFDYSSGLIALIGISSKANYSDVVAIPEVAPSTEFAPGM